MIRATEALVMYVAIVVVLAGGIAMVASTGVFI
jgi:hypothetical protein